VTYLDTNAVVALVAADLRSLSKDARRLLDRETDIRVSPMVVLELELLREIRRVRGTMHAHINFLAADIGLRVCDQPFADVARQAAEEAWTRDPFDRMIVAQARLAGAPLITRDQTMQARYAKAIG
jgi:PIN domain nuclease of toxin-antitoxin system